MAPRRRYRRRITRRYVPSALSRADLKKQVRELARSKRAYRRGQYYTRRRLASFKSTASPHVRKAMRMYRVNRIGATRALARATQCSVGSLRAILRKGRGAYYSSGSRPNQTAESWAVARLASAVSGGKSATVDFAELKRGCKPTSKALRLAKRVRTRRAVKRTVVV